MAEANLPVVFPGAYFSSSRGISSTRLQGLWLLFNRSEVVFTENVPIYWKKWDGKVWY